MFRIATTSRRILDRRLLVFGASQNNDGLNRVSKAALMNGRWPEPITQQTLDQFLKDINYFEEPRKFVNIGLKTSTPSLETPGQDQKQHSASRSLDGEVVPERGEADSAAGTNVEDVLDLLSEEVELASFNEDDAVISAEQLMNLAVTFGIYRDLFGSYQPDREYIKFTPDQANRLDRLVPHYWITDQPFARVERRPREPEPLHYFEPMVQISARFVHEIEPKENQDSGQYAHTSYFGNIIPASEMNVKPSITIDGARLSTSPKDPTGESHLDNWTPGQVSVTNFDKGDKKYYTIALLNLDSLHPDSSVLHWMVSNITPKKSSKDGTNYDELCDYLPVFGIRGFGYSRYVFLVFQHDAKLDKKKSSISNLSLDDRKFCPRSFMEQHQSTNLKPVGLSWFQTSWDESSNKIFHEYLNMRSPVYEHVQPKPEEAPIRKDYPGRVPFNIFLDHRRDKREINEQVLLERLKTVDPFDYRDQYVSPKVPPTVFADENVPSWMHNVLFKKKNRIGYWRGLRPASATLPLDNNADLDYPIRPIANTKKRPPGYHNQYIGKPKLKPIKSMPCYTTPANELTNVFVQEGFDIDLDKVKEMMKDFDAKQTEPAKSKTKDKQA